MDNVRYVASRHFRSKNREYLKTKTNELAIYSNKKNIRDIHRGINNLRRVSNLELTWLKMRMVIYFQIPTIV
jgi:hypothetical protein